MKIFNLVIMKQTDYDEEQRKQKEKIERLEKNHVAYVGTLVEEKHLLEDKIKSLKKTNLDETSDLRSQISILESELAVKNGTLDSQRLEIKSLKNSNCAYKRNNEKLSTKKKELENKLKELSKRYILPPDRTKSKLVPKVKSSSKQSSLVKMMNR